ncbi:MULTISPECIES: hypothetical protein [unclassified Bacillus cereus group]|nr:MULTISPECIES: hypothetical protein [unclassified Bacillus cereus group]
MKKIIIFCCLLANFVVLSGELSGVNQNDINKPQYNDLPYEH